MTLEDLKNNFSDIKNIININRSFTYQGNSYVFTFIGKENNNVVVWMVSVCADEEKVNLQKQKKIVTNREVMREHFHNQNRLVGRLNKIEINGHTMEIESATGEYGIISETNISLTADLVWMMCNGCNLDELEKIPVERLNIQKFKFSDKITLPMIKKEEPCSIKLFLHNYFETVKIHKSINLKMCEYGGKKYNILNKETGEKQIIYIDRLIHYDIWKQAETTFNDPVYKEKFTIEQLNDMKREYLKQIPNICPEGMDLAVIEYETENDIILDFYTQNFLNDEVKTNSSINAISIVTDSDSIRGHRVRSCVLGPIDKEFHGIMELEIYDYKKEIQGEVIEI